MPALNAKTQLEFAAQSISTAAELIRHQLPTMEAFLKECRDMENFGSIVAPTLYRDPERRAVSALMEPMFRAAVDFIRHYDAQMKQAAEALAKVSA